MHKVCAFTKILTALALFTLSTHFVYGQQSDVTGRLFEATTAANSAALAIGSAAGAGIGGVSLANSKFSGTAISTTTALNSAALALDSGANANVGGISVV